MFENARVMPRVFERGKDWCWPVSSHVQISGDCVVEEFYPVFERFRLELQRHKHRPFLEAVAAACALVATADGEVSFSERARLDAVIESLSELRLFDPREVVDAFDENVTKLEQGETGASALLDAITSGTRQDGAADLLMRISAAMSLADGQDSPDEHHAIHQICNALGLPDSAVDDAFAAIRG